MRGLPADVMRPNELVAETVVPGLLKFTLLKMLKNSARNCKVKRSARCVFFNSPTSLLNTRGPRSMFLPELPKVPGALGTNFEVSNHCAIMFACERSKGNWACPPRKSARSRPTPENELSKPLRIVKGKPLRHCVLVVASHPFTRAPRERGTRALGNW